MQHLGSCQERATREELSGYLAKFSFGVRLHIPTMRRQAMSEYTPGKPVQSPIIVVNDRVGYRRDIHIFIERIDKTSKTVMRYLRVIVKYPTVLGTKFYGLPDADIVRAAEAQIIPITDKYYLGMVHGDNGRVFAGVVIEHDRGAVLV